MARVLNKHGESHALLQSFLADQSLVAADSTQCGELGEVSSGLRQAMHRLSATDTHGGCGSAMTA